MKKQEQEAFALKKKAEGILTKWIYFGNKQEDASEFYTQAANKFKISKNYEEAADCYTKLVNCFIKMKSKYEAANSYVNAYNCYKKAGNTEKAISSIESAISMFTAISKFSQAAKYEKQLGETLEEEGDLKNSVEHLQNAADYFEAENQKSTSNNCLVKIAHIQALLEKYDEAIEIFETCAENAISDKLLKWGVKEYLFKACLCHLAKMESTEDVFDVKEQIEKYFDMDVHFPDSYEAKLINGIIEALENNDPSKNSLGLYTSALRSFDKIKKLEMWHTDILMKVRDIFTKEKDLN